MSNCVDIDLDKSLIEQIYDLQQENQELKKQNKKYKETIDKAINNCNNTLNYINNTILKNNIKVELNELLKIKGGLDTILESLVEEVE